jgi:S1-C subfamily serine protease
MDDVSIESGARWRRSASLALAGALSLGLAACGGPAKTVKPTKSEDDWRKQSLQLTVEGFMFGGAVQPAAATWFGSGAWIGPNVAVTNAHVALRGLKIVGKDDHGKEYVFDEILAVDESADLAIIRASSGVERYLALVDRPEDPKSLRGTNVRVIGNTGGLGLSFYDGRITNVIGDPENPVLLHDANTAGGASGGPLIESRSGDLVGVNHSSMPAINAKGAAPSWIVKKLVEQASTNRPLPLREAFATADMPVSWYVERALCLKPGEMFKGVFAAVATNDLVADVTPAQAGSPIGFILVGGNQELAKAVITDRAVGAWTLTQKGEYVFAVVNPQAAPGPACATVKFGRINWGERFGK